MPHHFLLNIYQEASYTIYPPQFPGLSHPPPPVFIRVGKKIDFSSRFPEKQGKAHLISACNPFSIPLSSEENRVRQNFLANQLSTAGLTFWPAIGHDPANFWVEPSWLVWNAKDQQIENWIWAWQQFGWLEIDSVGMVHLRQLPQTRSKNLPKSRSNSESFRPA